jgi:hypothetical protein
MLSWHESADCSAGPTSPPVAVVRRDRAFGVLSESIARRLRGLGIRVAVGASRAAVFGEVVRHGLLPSCYCYGVKAFVADAQGELGRGAQQ